MTSAAYWMVSSMLVASEPPSWMKKPSMASHTIDTSWLAVSAGGSMERVGLIAGANSVELSGGHPGLLGKSNGA